MDDVAFFQFFLCTTTKNYDRVVIDAGWSHPGYWARECTVIALDGRTGLPLAVQNVLKHRNFDGSSKCLSIFL